MSLLTAGVQTWCRGPSFLLRTVVCFYFSADLHISLCPPLFHCPSSCSPSILLCHLLFLLLLLPLSVRNWSFSKRVSLGKFSYPCLFQCKFSFLHHSLFSCKFSIPAKFFWNHSLCCIFSHLLPVFFSHFVTYVYIYLYVYIPMICEHLWLCG